MEIGCAQSQQMQAKNQIAMLKKIRGGFLLTLGYLLSPLSWWNDLFFNLPIAYAFGFVCSLWVSEWLVPATLVGYWLSNVAGFVLMQLGAADVIVQTTERNWKKDLFNSLITSTAFTVAIVALLQLHILETPDLGLGF
ncbi:hypothetical protein [Geitlerinema calcuttense]|uniref:MASE1 domain-containing protein n=1 Tax=Geitlerinema calcuttense NRMC-F 0142 TaxID=2922238 RepID=A0ABT7M0Z2_9CYAN|nr:hypothetical protein [Geitlerinema calcuttense]MDL5057719.1 hypothetical protein [Geitlerinema calcuttense NRMC-F 0142]